MSAKKFKVGDKVKVRKGLVADRFYGNTCCNSTMAEMSGRVLTIDCVKRFCYLVKENIFYWSDEMLEPVEKTLDNLCAGDLVVRKDCHANRVLAAINGCYLLSRGEEYAATGNWYTAAELDDLGYYPVELDTPEPTITIEGKKYKKADVEEAIKDLEPID